MPVTAACHFVCDNGSTPKQNEMGIWFHCSLFCVNCRWLFISALCNSWIRITLHFMQCTTKMKNYKLYGYCNNPD
jgi:hypothetical protein